MNFRKLSKQQILKVLETDNKGYRNGVYYTKDKKYISNGFIMVKNSFNGDLKYREDFHKDLLDKRIKGIHRSTEGLKPAV